MRKAGGGEAQAANKPKEALAPSWEKQKEAAGADVEMPGAERRSRLKGRQWTWQRGASTQLLCSHHEPEQTLTLAAGVAGVR